jgi:hypothetical protein
VQDGKNQRNNQPIYLKIATFMGRIDGEEDAAVFGGGGDVIDPSAAMAVMVRVKFMSESSRERGGKAHHKTYNNQPLTCFFNTVMAA